MTTASELTPAMRQYLRAKKDLPDKTILLFRMGDFYELFFEDAKTAAPLMDIVLTARAGVPMCGVPYHSMRGYIGKILDGGYNVAIAEQMEDPKLAKGLVKRDVTQIITPGTVLDDNLLDAAQSLFLAAILPSRNLCGLALLDFSTGDFRLTELRTVAALETEINRHRPAECLLPVSCLDRWRRDGFPDFPPHLTWTPLEDWNFDFEMAQDTLCRHFGVASLDGFGCRGLTAAVAAAGAMLGHVKNNLRRDGAHVTSLRTYQAEDGMILDRISQRNLELVEPIFADSKDNTLMSILDHTVTPMGARMLREWILRPLRDQAAIEERLNAVSDLLAMPTLLAELRELLAAVRDLERVVARLNFGGANARDLLVLQHGLDGIPGLRAVLADAAAQMLTSQRAELTELPEASGLIARAIVDEPPLAIKEGGIIRTGYHEELDILRRASTEGKDWIAGYQVKEQERTGIKSLKVRFNKVFGYYIEVTKTNLEMVPADYMRKQTLVNAERFITPELKEIEDKVLGAEEKSKALEYELFQD
ncbi:MAG TPA: DNA mismatch repair protein MutS, partial [Lentisphaeria bacterium]|nr:DNA mismatch repair protein MutS [Lentisphaeria bacterium]